MSSNTQVYIGLGSNKGDRLKFLQLAIDAIYKEIGQVVKISKVYETPAMGFEGENFYNACVAVTTGLNVNSLLSTLQSIENRLGRKRTKGDGYESREIDLDLLFYDEVILHSELLQLPHPRIQDRKFVLQPLVDIQPKLEHPVFKASMTDLLAECQDHSTIEAIKIWLKNPASQYGFKRLNYIAIEGNIGAGKTSLAQKIAGDFNAKLILERFADNPFLPKFYEDPQRYAFTLEMSFLADRYQQLSDDLSQLDLFKDFILSDYDVFKSLIFSKVTLGDDEFLLYRTLFYQIYKDISKPDLYVYLHQNPQQLQENIQKRGRNYEQSISLDYLERIQSGYLDFLKNQEVKNVLKIDITDRDFVENRTDYLWVLGQINEATIAIIDQEQQSQT